MRSAALPLRRREVTMPPSASRCRRRAECPLTPLRSAPSLLRRRAAQLVGSLASRRRALSAVRRVRASRSISSRRATAAIARSALFASCRNDTCGAAARNARLKSVWPCEVGEQKRSASSPWWRHSPRPDGCNSRHGRSPVRAGSSPAPVPCRRWVGLHGRLELMLEALGAGQHAVAAVGRVRRQRTHFQEHRVQLVAAVEASQRTKVQSILLGAVEHSWNGPTA